MLIQVVGASALAAVSLLVLMVALRQPQLHRNWDPDVAVIAGVRQGPGGAVEMTNLRDWTYSADTVTSREYFNASLDPADIVDVWLYRQQLDRWGLVAHTFVVFEFPESYGRSRYLGLSVETRRELGEQYSLIGGMMRKFELAHIWATERDLVERRVRYLGYSLERYRFAMPEEYKAAVFEKFVAETQSLAVRPRWYNTVRSNCTNSLVRYVNDIRPGAVPWDMSFVFTGRIHAHLLSLGYLDPDLVVVFTPGNLDDTPLR